MSDLRRLSSEDCEAQVRNFVASRSEPLNGEVIEINNRIALFESRYEMPSDTMRQQLHDNQIRETEEICTWLMLLHVRERLPAR